MRATAGVDSSATQMYESTEEIGEVPFDRQDPARDRNVTDRFLGRSGGQLADPPQR